MQNHLGRVAAQHAEFFVDGGLRGIAEVSAIWGATGGTEAA